MDELISKIGDSRLKNIIDTIELGNSEKFKEILNIFPEYDLAFLWLLAYSKEETKSQRTYIGNGYKKFRIFLDKEFPKLLATKGWFESRLWEMVLCYVLSSSEILIPKDKTGVDFHLRAKSGEIVQIEAVSPNESEDEKKRSLKPDLSEGNIFSYGGNIEDLEYPILLRVFSKGFIEKAETKKYDRNKPFIIAINSSKIVGLVSNDEYVLGRVLFGLGYITINQTGGVGFQQNIKLNRPEVPGPDLAVFRNPKYDHVSGIIYTSQRSLGFFPGGYSWHNSGITFVPNPRATHPVNLDFPFFKKILCDDERYQKLDPTQSFY